ncbi:MAG: hypothetical protein AB1746_03850 [Candidatus Zixiibacteriota bacterium]
MFGLTEFSIDSLTGQPFLTALFFIFFILFAVYLYRRTNPPLSPAIRILLTALRIIAVCALFLALFEPVMSYKREYDRKPKLTVLVDRSRSMENVENGLSRTARIDSLLDSEKFSSFLKAFDYQIEPFAADLLADDKLLDLDKTALGEVINQLSNKEIASPAEAWLLLSDGISNGGITPSEAAMRSRTPIFSVGVGLDASDKDIAVTGIDYNQVVFAGKPTTVSVQLEWQGMNGDKASVEIRSGQKILGSESITLAAGNLQQELPVKFIPDKPGQQTFKVSISGINDELSPENNSRSFSMTVLKSKMNVLLVSDRLDWEYAFLGRFLSRSESIDLTEVVYKKGGGYLTGSFPSNQADLNRNDLIVLYDVNMRALESKKDLLESFIKDKGSSVLIFLGENYLSASFPRWLDDFLPFINNRKSSRLVYFKFNGQPVENYLFHPAVRISDSRQSIREAWQTLPHFEALVPTDSVTPNSEILVTAGIGRGVMDTPIIGVRAFGAGRVLAVAASPFWQWAFFNYGFGGDDREYRLLMDGLVNWLSVKEESDPVKIIPDKTVYTRGEKVGFSAFVYDLGFRPIGGASGSVTLISESDNDSTVAQLVEREDGHYRAEFDILSPGRYKYLGVVNKDGRTLKESSGQIALESFSIEEYRKRPDFGTLASVSMMTGGKFYSLNEVDSLYFGIDTAKVAVSIQKEIILWNKFWLLAVFILSLALEWLMRKRYQLI